MQSAWAQKRAKVKNKAAAAAAVTETPVEPAPTGLTIGKIKIAGNKKIENDAVMARIGSKEGAEFTAERVRQDIEALFKTGYFYDIQVDRAQTGKVLDLTYTLVEKPSVVELNFEGNSELETDELREQSGLKAYEILNMSKIREATEKMQKMYEDKGYFLARITPRIEDVSPGETVKLTFKIEENDKVKVKRITFIGNKNITDGKLKSMMATREGGFFSFLSGTGSYKQDAFDRDVQLVSYVYFNEGYVQVKVDRPQVYVTPDRKGIYITFRVEEGERFKVGAVDFAGDLLFEKDDLYNSVDIDGSGWYVHETLLKDIRTLQAKYGDLGYAYANVIPRTRIREKDREVDITFEIDKGNKVYFGRINVVGNSKTRDKVLRRELQIREGELYNETRKRESLDNIRRLGFFEDANFNNSTPPDNPDIMNIDIVVKEKNTGTIQVGAGYSTYSQFIFNGSVRQENLFGRGQRLGLSIDFAKNQSLFNLNFTEPYFLDTEWSLGFDLYQSQRILSEYSETKRGGAVRVGHPLAPYTQGFIRYKLDSTQIDLDGTNGDPDLYPVSTANGLTSSTTFILEYDKRNDRLNPTKGLFSSISVEYAGVGGDKKYTKGEIANRFYSKLFWEVVLRNNLKYGFIRSNIGGDPPFNELYLLGGANSLRGFDWFSIGKRRRSAKIYNAAIAAGMSPDRAELQALRPFGGTQEAYYQAELEFPLIAEAGIKGVFFYDVGDADDVLRLDEFRSDVGFGFRWYSPIGQLRFEWGFPLARNPELGERAVSFQFAIGPAF